MEPPQAGTPLSWMPCSRGGILDFKSGLDRFGKNIGMKPGALTIICVGIDDNGNVVRNSSNGVYEHALPCPNNCPNNIDGYLH